MQLPQLNSPLPGPQLLLFRRGFRSTLGRLLCTEGFRGSGFRDLRGISGGIRRHLWGSSGFASLSVFCDGAQTLLRVLQKTYCLLAPGTETHLQGYVLCRMQAHGRSATCCCSERHVSTSPPPIPELHVGQSGQVSASCNKAFFTCRG